MTKKVAIQGFEGSFHQIAAYNYFGDNIDIVPCNTFSEVVHKITSEETDTGVLAIENSTAGSILKNYDLLQRSNLFIVGETYLHIAHHLMMLPESSIDDITKVHSHPMALMQCREYLERHPEWRVSETDDTALSAKHLKKYNRKNVAAIASELAAKQYGLKIIQKNIHSEKENYTRFLILDKAKKQKDKEQDHKSSLYFQVQDEPGCLAKVLACIGERKINLSKMQSFPIPGLDWQYYFHADLEFSTIEQFEQAIACIQPLTKKLRILGLYHKGDTNTHYKIEAQKN